MRGVAPEAVERDFEGAALRRLQDRRRRRGRRLARAGARALRRAARRRGRARGASSRPAPRRRARSRRARSPTSARRWGSARRGAPACAGRDPPGRPPSLRVPRVPRTEPSPRLELDLDVFAGPFDLLLSLILREELDLLEVELADVVLAYLDHLDARDELDLESATEFLVLIAALLELKSRLMLPGEEIEELDELAPAEAAEELLERMLAYARFRGAGGFLAARREAEQGALYRSAPLPPAAAPRAARAGRAGLRPGGARPGARRAAAHAAADRPAPHRGAARVAGGAARGAARAAAARHVLVRRGGAGRRPDDGRGHALRAARALQARRGRLGAGGVVRAGHGARRAARRSEAVA